MIQLILKQNEKDNVAVDILGELGPILGDVRSLRFPNRLPQPQRGRRLTSQTEQIADHKTLVDQKPPLGRCRNPCYGSQNEYLTKPFWGLETP